MLKLFITLLIFPSVVWARPILGKKLKKIELVKPIGSKIDGSPWSSTEITGKVHVLFYVDPDHKDLNEHVGVALKAEAFNKNIFGSFAIINMQASWMPNFVLDAALRKKQMDYPDTIYIKDNNKVLVKEWNVEDETSNVLAFDRTGKLFFYDYGKLTPEKVLLLVSLIKEKLALPVNANI